MEDLADPHEGAPQLLRAERSYGRRHDAVRGAKMKCWRNQHPIPPNSIIYSTARDKPTPHGYTQCKLRFKVPRCPYLEVRTSLARIGQRICSAQSCSARCV